MVNRAYAIATGAFVLLLAAAVAAMAIWLTGYRAARLPYLLVSRQSVMGLSAQTPVFYRGVPVGTVDSIGFDPRDLRNLLVRVEIDPGVPITRGTYGLLAPQGITGVVDVELEDSGRNPARLPTSAAAPGRIPLSPSVLDTLLASGNTLLARLAQLANPQNRQHIAQILANSAAATRQLLVLEKQMQATLATLADLSRQGRRTLGRIDALSARLLASSGSLDRLVRSATQLSRTGNAAAEDLRATTLPRLDGLLRELSATSRQLRGLAATLQQDPQSLLYGPASPPPGPGEAGYTGEQP